MKDCYIKDKEISYDLNIKSPQLNALTQLGFEYIILGQQSKRVYAFFDTDISKLSDYAKFKGIALSVDLFPPFIIEKLRPNVFYKI